MTKVLSDLLGAREPLFQQRLQQLERLAGHPQTDIRLTAEISQTMRTKLQALCLDFSDTTGPELYAAIGQRLKADEIRFGTALLTQAGAADDPTKYIASVLRRHIQPLNAFAIRHTVARNILRANMPRKTMKVLGYRSLDSMVKHESVATLYAAAWLVESNQWCKRTVTAYGRLSSRDFESRPLIIEQPTARRWQDLAETVVASGKHSVLSFKELGSVVLLPLPAHKPLLSTLLTTVLTLHAINEVRATGTFLKLSQMQPGFGSIVQQVVLGEPMLPAESLDQPVSWHVLHQFFARFSTVLRTDIFEPMVAAEELTWHSIERIVSKIEPSLEFWQHTPHLGMLKNGRPVTLNLTDALLSTSGGLSYEHRLSHYFKQSLSSEILLRYLGHDNAQQALFDTLHMKLATEMVTL
jgi:hypothetical protein